MSVFLPLEGPPSRSEGEARLRAEGSTPARVVWRPKTVRQTVVGVRGPGWNLGRGRASLLAPQTTAALAAAPP